ncbi:hypothetical protein BIU82_11935 [Arthrobacter sp. SW1]|uniref:hypothetical protein n=1 Tax=Arthrobacter sp. SW1 TaxID=1920889 RepID=UPI000877E8B7|nr:hypothetical protein [Arthrobacter sp. SW1]OFI36777.1 hypothetical protein BIU82_11935 [Arthrobacter sp. SW1]
MIEPVEIRVSVSTSSTPVIEPVEIRVSVSTSSTPVIEPVEIRVSGFDKLNHQGFALGAGASEPLDL